jgi:carbonic anhydrase/acetyltransferase-like protein (isoleucine patch superfamily)/DNA-binding GntR family transcriptional regulator
MESSHQDAVTSGARQSDQAFEQIKDQIILCRLAPGAHFSEAELSLKFSLARAATRAALTRLEEAGLVQPVPRHGFVVTPITIASVRDLFELRLMIEPQAAALAASKIDTKRLRALNRAPQDARTSDEQLSFVQSNRAFHREIALATGNRRVVELLDSLSDEMQRLVQIGLFGPGGSDAERHHADEQHETMIAAFEAKDAKAAEQAARHHIEHARGLAMERLMQGFGQIALAYNLSGGYMQMFTRGKEVNVDEAAFIHPTALLYGKIAIGTGSSVFPYVVMRSEAHEIRIGARTNIQDFVMIHVGNTTPTIVGDDCSITHHVTLHGCEIGDRCLIGINSTIMDGAKIGANSIVAEHSLVRAGQEFPENSIIAGSPAKLIKMRDCSASNLMNAQMYGVIARGYAQGRDRVS